MVTGDHPSTAYAIAHELGIAESDDQLVTGALISELKEGNPDELRDTVANSTVFARVSPLQKVDIIEQLTDAGHFVAVTGDGVNDAPALRKANIGVAMGSGTDVTKDTGAIIVTDDNFASIVNGVEEGRYAYQNLRKVIYLLISTGAAEVLLFTLALIFNLPIPLMAAQLLWLNLITNGIQDKAMAFEKGESGVMNEPPRNPQEKIFNPAMIQEVVTMGAIMAFVGFGLWYWLLNQGWEPATARNMLLMLMVFFENYHAFNCRSETRSVFQISIRDNWFLVATVLTAFGVHIAALFIPFFQRVLGTAPVSWGAFFSMLGLASTIMVGSELFKLFKRHRQRARA